MRKVITRLQTTSLVATLALAGAAGCGAAADGGQGNGAARGNGSSSRDGGASGGESPTSGGGARDGGAAGPDFSRFVGWQSFHPSGAQKTYNSGFDGTNEYVVPMVFFAPTQPKVTFGDPSAAEVNGPVLTVSRALVPELPEQLDGKIQVVFVKAKKAGQTTVTGVAGSVNETATLKITQYAAADVAVGERRYTQGAPSCESCHATKSVHNPGLLADLSDETILGIAVEGKAIQRINPETTQVETVQPNGGNHKWTVTPAERVGLMAYLRSRSFQFQLPTSGGAQ